MHIYQDIILQSLSSNFLWPGRSSNPKNFDFWYFQIEGTDGRSTNIYQHKTSPTPPKFWEVLSGRRDMKPRGRGLYLKCLALLSLNLLSKPSNILSPRKMISSTSEEMIYLLGRSLKMKIFFTRKKRLRKIWKGREGIESCSKISKFFAFQQSSSMVVEIGRLQKTLSSLLRIFAKFDWKKFFLFHEGKRLLWKFLPIQKQSHQSHSKMIQTRQQPFPKTNFAKNLLLFFSFSDSLWSDQAESHSINFRFFTSLRALSLEKSFFKNCQSFYLVLTQACWNSKSSKSFTDCKHHHISERRMQLETW